MKALAIISTILTLLFVFLWFSEKSDAEKARDEQRIAEEATAAAEVRAGQIRDKLVEVSNKVGFQEGAETKPELIDPGAWAKTIEDNATIKVPKEFWTKTEGSSDVAFDLRRFPPELRAKIDQVRASRPPDPPVIPDDDASDAERQAYTTAKEEYDRKFKAYVDEFDAIFKTPEFAAFKADIGSVSAWVLEKPEDVLVVSFFNQAAGATKLEDVVKMPGPTLQNMRTAFETNAAKWIGDILALRKEIAEKEKTITSPDEAALGLREQLQREQAAHTSDVERLQREVQDATAKAESFRVEASTAQNELAQVREQTAREKRTLEQRIAALTEFQRGTKEKMDLEIRRNDPDGTILDSSVTLGTAYIDLGSVDRVFPGLKFEVNGVGRGGFPQPKGTILVQKVLDAHYSQVTILPGAGDGAIVRGDTIHNPFYDKSKTIHVFLAGDLKKYPKSVAAARLRRANVVIDEALGTQTDYVVVPDTLRAPLPTATPEEGGDGEAVPAVAGQGQYEMLRERARTFGATLITERQLEAFLDY